LSEVSLGSGKPFSKKVCASTLREFLIEPATNPLLLLGDPSLRLCAKRLMTLVLLAEDSNDSRKISSSIPIEDKKSFHFLHTLDPNCLYLDVVAESWEVSTARCR
jgi:hypothetical protein